MQWGCAKKKLKEGKVRNLGFVSIKEGQLFTEGNRSPHFYWDKYSTCAVIVMENWVAALAKTG